MSVFVNGRLLVTPTVESIIYDAGLASVSPGRSTNIVAIIGNSDGGKPQTPLFFDNPVVARRSLRSGELMRGVENAFDPSAETGSPYRVCAIRVEQAVQSSLILKDGSSNDVITLTSSDYGGHTNNIKVTIASGTLSGKKITVQEESTIYVKDNLTRTPFTVRYSGAQATATVEITATQLKLCAPALTTVATLNFSAYSSVRALCDAINATSGFSTVVSIPTGSVQATLDGMTPTSCKSLDLAIKADLQAVIDWVNQYAGELVTAARVTGALAAPANLAATYLAGGSNGSAPSNNDWQAAFDALQGADVQWLVPLSSSSAIWAMASAHCAFMSSAGHSERRAFVGGDVISGTLATAISTADSNALALNDDRTSLVFNPILDYDDNGALVNLPAYFAAATIAGGFGAVTPGNTLTNKSLKLTGIQPVLSNVYDCDSLINSGVIGIRKDKRGFIVNKAVSTWRSNSNYNRVEVSTGAALDYVARTVREALSIFVGRKASPITLHEAISVADSTLRDLARPEPVGLGVIVGDEANPAYKNISAEITGDILKVWFACNVVVPINYVIIPIYAQAYSGTALAATTGL